MTKETGSTERWRIAENVVAAIQRSIGASEGWKVMQNVAVKKRGSERRRQVDVLVEHASGLRIGIDIKAKRRPLDIEVVEQLCCKLRKLELDERIIVSTSGFTTPAREEAKEAEVRTVSLDELEVSPILRVATLDCQFSNVKDIEIVFRLGASRPPSELLMLCKMRIGGDIVSLADLAHSIAFQVMQAGKGWKEGEANLIRVIDEHQQWSGLVIGDREWEAPAALNISWFYSADRFRGSLFQCEEGQQAFSAIVPINGEQQVTVVTIPNPDGGFQVSTSIGEVRPRRTKA